MAQAQAMVLAVFVGTLFGIVLTAYFVKMARRLCSLLEALDRETELRIAREYGLPGPMPVPKPRLDEGE